MKVLKPYDKLYTSEKSRQILNAPRSCGKSVAMAQKLAQTCIDNPNRDIFVGRANYNSLHDSFAQEILDVQASIGFDLK